MQINDLCSESILPDVLDASRVCKDNILQIMAALEGSLINSCHSCRYRDLLQIAVCGDTARMDRRYTIRPDCHRNLYLCHAILHRKVNQLICRVDLIHDLSGLINRFAFTVRSGLNRISACIHLGLLHDDLIQVSVRILERDGICLRELVCFRSSCRLEIN